MERLLSACRCNLQPKFSPASGDAASKLIIATKFAHGTDAALELTSAIMHAFWAEDKNIMDADTLAGLASAAGHDGAALVKASETTSVQNEYEQFTNDAMAASVFGAHGISSTAKPSGARTAWISWNAHSRNKSSNTVFGNTSNISSNKLRATHHHDVVARLFL